MHSNTFVDTATRAVGHSTVNSTPFEVIEELDRHRSEVSPLRKLDLLRSAAKKIHQKMRSGPKVLFFASFPLVKIPYPTRYGFLNAANGKVPYITILNRMFIVQWKSNHGVKSMLISPSDVEANGETPFFKGLRRDFGIIASILEKTIAKRIDTVESWLAKSGISPEEIDYISFDHLHTQDLRKWLQGESGGLFPKAKLLVTRHEWDATQNLIQPQVPWYCPNGTSGIPDSRLVKIDCDVLLGDGVAVVKTPGHTLGNHSFCINTPDGIFVISENGISADSYSPQHSNIVSIRNYHKTSGMEVVLNGNTLECGLDQYISMIVEKEIAGPSQKDPRFTNFFPSSEFVYSPFFPGIKPSFSHPELSFGHYHTRSKEQE